MAEPLAFWFEFASPYSYLSAMRIQTMAREAGVALVLRPILLGPIFAAQGWNDSPFKIYPAKGVYLWQDMAREAAAAGLAFQKPSSFPRGSLLAARIVTANAHEPWAMDFTRAVFRANFAEDRAVERPEVIAELLNTLGLEAQALVQQAAEPAVKDALRAQTEAAQARGLFGAPSFTVGDTLFWGNDRLERALECAKTFG